MPVADIQVFASDGLLPRSSVFGLLDQPEYRPIRLGRGLWDKREHTAIPWPEGHGALVDEWCHYALGLKIGISTTIRRPGTAWSCPSSA